MEAGTKPLSDREGSSDDDAAVLHAVAGESLTPLTEEEQIQVGDITERLRQVYDMLSVARSLVNPHIVNALEQARHKLLRQATGTLCIDPDVAAAAREVRLPCTLHCGSRCATSNLGPPRQKDGGHARSTYTLTGTAYKLFGGVS